MTLVTRASGATAVATSSAATERARGSSVGNARLEPTPTSTRRGTSVTATLSVGPVARPAGSPSRSLSWECRLIINLVLLIGVWTNMVPARRSMTVGYGPRPGGRRDARHAWADFSSSSATDYVQPESTEYLPMWWCRAPALLVGTPGRPSTDVPTANILSKLELITLFTYLLNPARQGLCEAAWG